MVKDKKAEQLGMNPATASGRLVKDVLFHLMCQAGKNVCYHCGKPMLREDFSIEHKEPWLDSADPKKMFFSLDNIAFSHLRCNSGAARSARSLGLTPEERVARKLSYDKDYRRKERAKNNIPVV